MSSSGSLAEFAARLRGIIRVFAEASEPRPAEIPSFDQLALELFQLQYEHNSAYRRFSQARHARPGDVGHWTAIPSVPSSAFKELDLSCLPADERIAVFHSSGTTRQERSRHFHSADSLALYEASLWGWFKAHCAYAAEQRPRLMILTPALEQVPHSSLAHMFETIRRHLGADESSFLGMLGEDGVWDLDLEASVQRLQRASAAGQPLLVLGTAFSFVHLLDHLAGDGLRFVLPPGSCALETGGYKGRSRVMPKGALHAMISQRLGIAPDQVLCEYGMSELSSQAYDSSIGLSRETQQATRCFAFPPWARVRIISPETGCEVEDGETGLIRVCDLANVWSVMAVQTEDLGGRRGAAFTLAGRSILAEPRGCSLMAV
jgi:hypothetical protein